MKGKVVRTYFGAGEEAHRAADEDARKQARRKLVRGWKRDLQECDQWIDRRLMVSQILEQVLLDFDRDQEAKRQAAAISHTLSPAALNRLRERLAQELHVPADEPPRLIFVPVGKSRLARRGGGVALERRSSRSGAVNDWATTLKRGIPRCVASLLTSRRFPSRRLVRVRARGPPWQTYLANLGGPPQAGGLQAVVRLRAGCEKPSVGPVRRGLAFPDPPPKGLCCA